MASDIIDIMSEELITDYDIRGKINTDITVEVAWNIGKAVADWLSTAGSVVVLAHPGVGEMRHAVTEGLRLQGRAVVDGGVGDKDAVVAYIKTSGLSGGVIINYDQATEIISIELYQEAGLRVEKESGLTDLYETASAGNFVPAAIKGELTAIA